MLAGWNAPLARTIIHQRQSYVTGFSARRTTVEVSADRDKATHRAITTSPAVRRRPVSSNASTRSRRRVRYGYRRIHALLRLEGWLVNAKRVNRLYREMGLQLRNKSPKRKVKAKLREGRSAPAGANDVWAMDFGHDQLYDGRKTRILTVIDAFTRYVPAIEVRARFTGADVAAALEIVCRNVGYPKSIRVDQGARVRLQGSRYVGLCPRCQTRLLATRQADGRRLHREPERQVPRRVSVAALVPEPCCRAAKMRALA